MKLKKLFTIILCVIFSSKLIAQITYEHTYSIQAGQETPFLTNLGNNNFKYVHYDFYNDLFSLYNIDHTAFMLNIPLAISGDSGKKYVLGYITNSLFDCDSTNIEYALMASSPNDALKFLVYRTDGTLIFSKDSVTVPWGLGYNVGSLEIRGITNTNAGAKLMLFNRQNQFFVYGLCGILPENITEIYQTNNYVKVFPIPSSDQITFQVTPPGNLEEYELIIFDSRFQIIKTVAIDGMLNEINLDAKSVTSGSYFYSLQNKNKVFQTGKFIISK